MKLMHRVWLIALAVLLLAGVALGVVSYRQAGQRVEAEVLTTVQTVRDLLMTVRYTYHQRFLASGLPLTDQTLGFLPAHAMASLSDDFQRFHHLGIRFRNVSDRARNPANQADASEMEAMAWFRNHPEASERLVEVASAEGARQYLYATPIRIDAYCLTCHGRQEDAPETIRRRYDAGFGYQLGELRGVLSIRVPADAAEASIRKALVREQLIQLVGFLLAMLVGGVLMQRLVVRHLESFRDGALAVARGDYAARLKAGGADETAELAEAFNTMAATIQQREGALRESETRWQFALEGSEQGVWDWRRDLDRVFYSPRWKAMLGYAEDEIGDRFDDWRSRVHPDDLAPSEATLSRVFARQTPYYANEHRLRCKDGNYKWILARGQVVEWSPDGVPLRVIGTHTDISRAKRFEAALAATAEFVSAPGGEDFARDLVRHAALTLGLDYVHVARLVPGQARVETLAAWLDGGPIENWAYDLDRTPCAEVLQQARRCIVSGVREAYPDDADLGKIGAEAYVGEPVVNSSGEIQGLIVAITRKPLAEAEMVQANLRILAARAGAEFEQRDAMEQLHREADTNRNILQTVEAIIVALDSQGRITLINRKGCQLLGYEEADLLGRDWFATCVPEGRADQVRPVFLKALAGDLGGSEYFENPVRTRSGEERLIAWHNSTIRAADGSVIGGLSAGEDITERKRAEAALRESEERYRLAFQTSPDAVNINRLSDGLYLAVNTGFERLTGWRAHEVIGRTSLELGIWHDPADRRRLVEAIQRDGYCTDLEATFVTRSGGYVIGLMSAHRMDLHGESCILSITRDITDKKRAEESLRASEMMFHTMVDWTYDWEYWIKPDGSFRYMSPSVERVTGYRADDFNHNPALIDVIVHPEDRHLWQQHVGEHLPGAADDAVAELDFRIVRRQGNIIWVTHTCRPVSDAEGHYLGRRVTVRDITARKDAEERIRHLAYFDPLTGLANRRLLMDRLGQSLIAGSRSGQIGALLLLDLDHFKTLNEVHGHDVGDRLLVEVARRINNSLRQEDTVARLGGDEFVVMLEGLGSDLQGAANQAEMVAEKVRQALNRPYVLKVGESEHHSTPSIGVTLYRGQEDSAEVLLKQAEVALYQAKDAGRNTVRFFDPAMQAAVETRSELEAGLRQGLHNGELRLHYQPQVDHEGRCIGAEALLRWERPGHGLVAPGTFIALAEETGLILPIGRWVVDTACAQLRAWQEDPATRDLTLAINVSAKQFHQPDFVEQVHASLVHSGADPSRLKLELTESVVLNNVEQVIARMQQLKVLGVRFSMDDFGTGYSSLSYLKQLPLDQLKIDQSFVRDISVDPSNAAIVRAILALSRTLGLDAIAEGVETPEQHAYLLENGCTAFQGYLFGRPVAIEEWGGPGAQPTPPK